MFQAGRSPASVDDLPDTLLLRVFRELQEDPLFVATVVGRVSLKWQALSRDPSLWSDVSVECPPPQVRRKKSDGHRDM